MSENETIAEIRKETEPRFRELLEKHVDSWGHIQAMQQFNQVFDRIEAVEKRERNEIEASALAVGGVVEASHHKASGNAAEKPHVDGAKMSAEEVYEILKDFHDEHYHIDPDGLDKSLCHAYYREFVNPGWGCNTSAMREALENIYLTATKAFFQRIGYDVACGIIRSTARHALSAPPRNCDVYDSKSCRMAYHLHGDGILTMQAFANWLFALAEKEGDAK